MDDTDYDLDTNTAVKVEVVPLKSLAALLLAVPHWNPDLQSRTRLLYGSWLFGVQLIAVIGPS